MSKDQRSLPECSNHPAEKCLRPDAIRNVIVCYRPLNTIAAKYVSRVRRKRGYKQEAMSHWALKIGDDLFWELRKSMRKSLVEHRLKQFQWEKHGWKEGSMVGTTCLEPDAIEECAIDVISHMKTKHTMHNGTYDAKNNNCQHFATKLWTLICHEGPKPKTEEFSRPSDSKVKRRSQSQSTQNRKEKSKKQNTQNGKEESKRQSTQIGKEESKRQSTQIGKEESKRQSTQNGKQPNLNAEVHRRTNGSASQKKKN